jgi:ABC-2 type transport system ATP-binding protein
MSAVIQVDQVRQSFGKHEVLSGVEFEVRQGEVLGLLGANGSGKSTLLRIVTAIDSAASGRVRLIPSRGEGACRVGALLDPAWLDERLTCRQHLAIALLNAQGRSDRQTIRAALEMVGLTSAERRRVKHLSLGMRQRLALALALIDDPDVLVLDEPLNGLDPDGVLWIRGLLEDFARSGRAVLLSSHLLAEMERIADRVVLLSGGLVSELDLHTTQEQSIVMAKVVGDIDPLCRRLSELRIRFQTTSAGALAVHDCSPSDVFRAAVESGVTLEQLSEASRTLEDRYRDAVANHESPS